MHIRDYQPSDLTALIDLTIDTFQPLFEQHLPGLVAPAVLAHDHGDWRADYREEVPSLHDPERDRFITLAEEDGRILGYVGWSVTNGDSGRLEMVAVHPEARRHGVGSTLCGAVLELLRGRGVAVV